MSRKISIDDVVDFANEYIREIIYFILILVVISLVSVYVLYRIERKNNDLMIKYYNAGITIGSNRDESINALSNVYENAGGNIKNIAGLKLANLMNDDKKIEIFLEIYNSKSGDSYLRNLAGLNAVSALINKNNENDYKKIVDLLNKMKENDNPLVNLIDEQEAIFEIQKGNAERGKSLLQQIIGRDNIDVYQRQRIKDILNLE
ncbi:MAG: hypothetical protein LBC92_04370 [Rickettsiales bacterium]|jgi:hypothetical protein|nr:hypothetical protein [Rickettsiales bacterium]